MILGGKSSTDDGAPAPVNLIMSAAYVEQELAVEFGHLPPSFLPVGTRRLYELQRERFGGASPVYVTLPESFHPCPTDVTTMAALDLLPLPLPDGLRLGEAVVYALNLLGGADRAVRILHGDTVAEGMPVAGADCIGAAGASEGYSWAEIERDGDRIIGLETVEPGLPCAQQRPIACGVFAFSHSTALVRAITRARGDFIQGLVLYGAEHPLTIAPVSAWYDFGHLRTFFRSRRMVTTARSFNTVQIDGKIARKISMDAHKMQAEAHWLASVPAAVQIYTARILQQGQDGQGRQFYDTEYAYLPTLSELFVFATLSRSAWQCIIDSCGEFLTTTAAATDPAAVPGSADHILAALVIYKTEQRLVQFADASGFDVDAILRIDGRPMPSLMRIAGELAGGLNLASGRSTCVMHGDFCFSNILYDSRVQRIRVIDPRGYVQPGQASIYGDLRYDLAKMTHSVVGRYDQIIAGRYSVPPDDGPRFAITFETAPHHGWLEEALRSMQVDGVAARSREIDCINAGLFLSMLPLHADRPDRQRAFIANALRLYSKMQDTVERAA